MRENDSEHNAACAILAMAEVFGVKKNDLHAFVVGYAAAQRGAYPEHAQSLAAAVVKVNEEYGDIA